MTVHEESSNSEGIERRVIETLVALREERGWSQSELARRMVEAGWPKYTQMTVSRTEKGDRPLRLDEAESLAKVFDVELVSLWMPRQEAEFKRIQGVIYRRSGEITLATYRLLVAQDELKEWADANGVKIPKSFEEAKTYGKGSRERDIYYSLTAKSPMDAVRAGEETHEGNKQVGLNPRGEHREVEDGEYPEEG